MSGGIDRRELILTRLHEVLHAIDSSKAAYRDRGGVPENLRPCWLLLDADEAAREPEISRPNRVLQPSAPITLKPEVYYMVAPRTNPAQADTIDALSIGQELNDMRKQAFKAVLEDAHQLELVGGPQGGGRIRYMGCNTDMKVGEPMQGLIQLLFEFDYPLISSEL